MKAAIYRDNGGPEVLLYEDVPDPTAGPDEVLIRVEAISIEGGDLLSRQMVPLQEDFHIVGYSTAGTVIAVGESVTDLRVGQRVTAYGQHGSHAELRAVRADECWVIPDGLDAVAAACVPVAFGTAHEALFERASIGAGSTVLIQGATGGVGFAAVQLAARAGARVIGTGSSPANLDSLRRLGLHEGIDYSTENVRERVLELTGGLGAHLVVDPVGGPMTQELVFATREGGAVLLVGGSAREATTVDAITLILRGATLSGFRNVGMYHRPNVRAYIAQILQRIADGELEVIVDRVFQLAQAPEAHRYAEQRGRVGRVVMVP